LSGVDAKNLPSFSGAVVYSSYNRNCCRVQQPFW
jgi:hypothetical protein